MKKILPFVLVILMLSGCSTPPEETSSLYRSDAIAFDDDQLYAAAYLGYLEMPDLSFYTQTYLGYEELPCHYISGGEFYLIIPRYDDMALKLYRNDIETLESTLLFETQQSLPFIVQCNSSDIFADLTVSLTYGERSATFSPFLSLKDGSVQIGEYGLDLTRETSPAA